MACQGAASVRQMFTDANRIASSRRKASDGICASQQHSSQNPRSDHEPDARGIAHAGDLTHSPAEGWDAHKRVRQAVARRDVRIKYVISQRKIISYYPVGSYPAWAERPYGGSNPHTLHAHTSIRSGTQFENDTSPWWDGSQPGGGDEVTDADIARIAQIIDTKLEPIRADIDDLQVRMVAVFESVGKPYVKGVSIQKALMKGIVDPATGQGAYYEHLDIIQSKTDELIATVGELADALKQHIGHDGGSGDGT